MTRELVTEFGDREIGRLLRSPNGRTSFVYDDAYRRSETARPLSLSMPLGLTEHGRATVEAFLWGLLPDNELILERWAKRFRVSARNPFALLEHVGADCAGAVRFVSAARPETRSADLGAIQFVLRRGIAERLRALAGDASAWRAPADEGQFSLGGAQPKIALWSDGKRWGVPYGRTPTTYILKPGVAGLDGHAENEHFCLSLARGLGMPVAASRVLHFEDQVAIVVERYDRRVSRDGVERVHQEDVCQALAVPPSKKYESAGGPGVKAVAALLREHSGAPDEDIGTFVDSLAYSWLIAGTDAHAKNYSLLIGERGRVRLAPLYDLASALPYRHLAVHKLKLAMKIGGKYRLREIGAHQWGKFAGEIGSDGGRGAGATGSTTGSFLTGSGSGKGGGAAATELTVPQSGQAGRLTGS